MAHLDVVPVEGDWQHGAFSGEIADGQIWGRGTLDDKGALVGVCEAVETLLERDFTPAQDVWLSFGCDEEVFGTAAAAWPSSELRSRGVRPWFVVDEGGAIAHDAFPGVGKPVGVVGVTEKGVTSLELRVEGRGGHASTPAQARPDGAAGPGDHPARPTHRCRPASRPRRSSCSAGWRRTRRSRCDR